MWFKLLGKLFLNTDDIELQSNLGAEFIITVKDIPTEKVDKFKEYVDKHTFVFNVPIKVVNLKAENENKERYIEVKLVEAEMMTRKGYLFKCKGYTNTDLHFEDDANGYILKDIKGHVIGWEYYNVFNKQYLRLPADAGISISERVVDDFIKKIHISTVGDKTTLVRAVLRNGFEITESSSCVDKSKYNQDVGKKICMKKIKDKVRFLLGFLLQTAKDGINN